MLSKYPTNTVDPMPLEKNISSKIDDVNSCSVIYSLNNRK